MFSGNRSNPRGVRRALTAAGLLALVLGATATCRSSSTSVVGPSGSKCSISVPSNLPSIAADGGTGTVAVSVAAECLWSASSEADWLAITSDASGQGNGTLSFAAGVNPASTTRRGALRVSERRVEVVQTGAPCRFTVMPSTTTTGAAGGQSTVTVDAVGGCQWSAVSQAPWISVTSGASGVGAGTASLSIGANPGPARVGIVTIAGQSHMVSQAAANTPGCSYGIDAPGQSVGAAGGPAAVGVAASPGCAWSATSLAPWITVTSGGTGSGGGTVSLRVDANTGPLRVGTVTVAGQAHSITQQSGAIVTCLYGLSATGQTIGAGGGSAAVNVTAGNGCSWNASSDAPWISIISGASGTGNGSVVLAVGVNTGDERVGTVSIAGHTHTITQQASGSVSCSYALNPTQQNLTAVGGPATFAVTTANGCGWTATSNAAWITVTSGGSGMGSGSVVVLVGVNVGGQRTGTITVGGQTHTITQAAVVVVCSFALDATAATIASAGGTIAVAVSAADGCSWTAASQAPWISVASGSPGSGGGTVILNIGSNGAGQRVGVVTIAGRTFTVTQEAVVATPACTFTVSPGTQNVSTLGGTFTVAVTTQSGCAWAAATDDGWIQLRGATSGTGSGDITYRIGLGLLFSRAGLITVADQTITVNQPALLLE